MGLLFTQEQIEKVNCMNILEYAKDMGLNPIKFSSNTYKIKGYGGLYIHANGSKWNWFSQGKGGGIIQFVMAMQEITWKEAMEQLLDQNYSIVIPQSVKDEPEKREMILPKKNHSNQHLIDYLVRIRRIDWSIVSHFIKEGTLYENNYRSCVLVGMDENKIPKYAFVRSTNLIGEPFKMEVKNSDKRYCFHKEGSNSTVLVFEAAIELLSYYTLNLIRKEKNYNHMLDLGGTSDIALMEYLKRHHEIVNVVLCLNNDEAGHNACNKLKNKLETQGYGVEIRLPESKDYNLDLKKLSRSTKIYNVQEQEEISMEL